MSSELEALPEHRPITMMFVDLVGSTIIAQGYPLEQGHEIIDRFRKTVLQAVAIHGGNLVRTEGDGMLIAFGDPIVRQDDPERGVLAALEVHRGLKALEAREGLAYRTRIGVSTTIVLVESADARERMKAEGYHGLGPILARRLQDMAGEGNTLVCDSTWERVKDQFEGELRPNLEFKNFNAPVDAWKVLRELPGATRLRNIAGPVKSSLIGRNAELAHLMKAWDSVRTEGLKVILLSGDPGVGKSRLLSAHRNHPALGRRSTLVYKCLRHYDRTPYFPFSSQMELWMGIRSEDTTEARQAKLNAKMQRHLDEERLTVLTALMAPSPESELKLQSMPEHVFQNHILSAFVQAMQALTREVPALIHFEDIHWIDPSSRELLNRALPEIAELPILLIASHRKDVTPELSIPERTERLALGTLHTSHGARLVRELDPARDLDDHTVERIVQVTQGMPLYIEHFVSMMLGGKLDAAELSPADEPAQVPDQVFGLLFEHLDDTGSDKGAALAATAIGRPFDTRLLAAAAGMSLEKTQGVIDRLLKRGVLRISKSDAELPYQFAHALVLDAGYRSMVSRHSEILHERIARHLADERPELAARDPGLLARQFRKAGIHDRAIEMSLQAGNRARAKFAYHEAKLHSERAIRLLRELPEADRPLPAMQLYLMLGVANAALKGYGTAETLDAFNQAFELAAEIGDEKIFMRAAQGLFAAYHAHANYELAGSFGLRIQERIDRSGSSLDTARARSFANGITGSALIWQGAFRQAHQTLSQALEESQTAGTTMRADASSHQTIASLALVEAFLGKTESATLLARDAIRAAQISGSPMAIGNAMLMSCNVHQILRHPDALEQARALEQFARQQQMPFYRYGSQSFIGVAHYQDEERVEEGYELLLEAWEMFKRTAARANQVFVCVERAEGCRLMGRYAEGLEAIKEGLDLAEQFGERNFEAELHRLRGALMVELGDNSDAALEHIELGLKTSQDQGARMFELRARTELAELAVAGRADTAHIAALADLVASWPRDTASPDTTSPDTTSPDLARARAVLARANPTLPG